MPLSVECRQKETATPTSSDPPPSLLSQSYFLKKLQESVKVVIDAMQNQLSAMQPVDDASVHEDIMGCNNSIATQSAFAFSQLGDGENGNDQVAN